MESTKRLDRTRELLARLEHEVATLTTSDGWRRYLTMQAKLHRYSWRNTLLILTQKSDANHVAGYQSWQLLGRHVRRGEKGIAILAPHTYTGHRAEKDSTGQLDGEDVDTRLGFHVTHVWDISQTDGPELVGQWGYTTGDAATSREVLERLEDFARSEGFAVNRDREPGSVRGHCDHKSRVIVLDADLDTVNTLAVLAHELGHALLHDGITDYRERRAHYEAEAESVAYVVVAGLGLDASQCQLPYLARWTGGDPKILREAAQRVQSIAHRLLTVATKAPRATEALMQAA